MAENTYAHRAQRQKTDDNSDFYPTPPWATRALMEYAVIDYRGRSCFEPACGQGHMAETLKEYFATVDAADLVDRGYGNVQNFLTINDWVKTDWVITNPPFSLAHEFIEKALKVSTVGVAMFARTQLLEGKKRWETVYRDNPPTLVMPFVERVPLQKNKLNQKGSTATSYSWFIWFHGSFLSQVRWIPPCRKRLEKDSDYEPIRNSDYVS